MVQVLLSNHSRSQRINRLLPASSLCLTALSSTAGPITFSLFLFAFGQQAFCLDSGKALIPERKRDSNMLLQSLSEGLHAFSLRVNLSIQADRKADHKTLCPCFVDQALNGFPGLSFITSDMQCCIGGGQESAGIANCYADSGLPHIQRYQLCHVALSGQEKADSYIILTKKHLICYIILTAGHLVCLASKQLGDVFEKFLTVSRTSNLQVQAAQ